jgi:hypothetical protein
MKSRGWSAQSGILIATVILLGIGLRAYHYLRNPSVWHDEAAVLVNVLPLGFGELLGPLRHAEAAPPLFLWLERATALTLADGTLALRLPPFVASIATLVLIVCTARREAGQTAAFWAGLLAACSDRLLWHSCEAKPYAFDVLAAATLLAILCGTRDWPTGRRALAFLPLTPVVIWTSYPACFLCGGILLALLPAIRRTRQRRDLAGYGLLAFAVVGSFALLYLGPAHAQRCSAMESCWTGQFPNWGRPWAVPVWSVASSVDVFRYCFMPWGWLLAGFAIAGGVQLYRMRRAEFVVAAVAPLALNLIASWLHGYPYGGARVVVHAAPGLAILTAAGVGPSLSWLRVRSSCATVTAVIVLLIPPGYTGYRLAVPWYRADCDLGAAYILAHRTGVEPVVANHWEFEYYCRGIGDRFRYMSPDLTLPTDRIWVALTAFDPHERATLFDRMTSGRKVLNRRDFTGVIVALVDADMPPSVAAAPPGS